MHHKWIRWFKSTFWLVQAANPRGVSPKFSSFPVLNVSCTKKLCVCKKKGKQNKLCVCDVCVCVISPSSALFPFHTCHAGENCVRAQKKENTTKYVYVCCVSSRQSSALSPSHTSRARKNCGCVRKRKNKTNCVYVCVCVNLQVFVRFTRVAQYNCVYCMLIRVYLCVWERECMCVCECAYTFMYIYECIYLYICIYLYAFVYIYKYCTYVPLKNGQNVL